MFVGVVALCYDVYNGVLKLPQTQSKIFDLFINLCFYFKCKDLFNFQGFINRKPKIGRRDSVISSINTDYTYEDTTPSVIGTEYDGGSRRGSIISHTLDLQDEEATPSLYGTEYEGDNSQRSSLTSNNDENSNNQVKCVKS